MVYGVDECRRCGKSMPIPNPQSFQRYKESLRQKPTMTPQQWHKAGWKAPPNRWQLSHPLDGVCFECSPGVLAASRKSYRLYYVIAAIILGFTIIYFVANAMH